MSIDIPHLSPTVLPYAGGKKTVRLGHRRGGCLLGDMEGVATRARADGHAVSEKSVGIQYLAQ